MSYILMYNFLLKIINEMTTQIQTTNLNSEKDRNADIVLNRDYIIEEHVYPSKKYFKVVIK